MGRAGRHRKLMGAPSSGIVDPLEEAREEQSCGNRGKELKGGDNWRGRRVS